MVFGFSELLVQRACSSWRFPDRLVAKREAYARRCTVRRTSARLRNYRCILIRWECHLAVYEGFMAFVLMLVCVDRLVR